MVKSLGKFLLGRQVRRNRGAPPAPVVEYIVPVPAVISSPKPVVEFLAPAPAVFYAATPVVESIAPVPVVFHAPVFPLETPTVFHGRELPPGRRDGLVVMPCGFGRRLLGVGMRGGGSNVLGSFLRHEQRVCLLMVRAFWSRRLGGTLREWAMRGKRTSASGKGSGEGAGARVAVRSVLEDHETAVLELERVVSIIEDRIGELEHKVSGVCCDSEKRQLVVAELEGKFVLFSAEVIFEFKSQWSGILNEVHGYCGDWLEGGIS